MTNRTLRISARMAEEIQQWASDELGMSPRDTAYAADLESLLAQLTAEQPALAHIAAAACTCGHCGGLVCCQNCGTPPRPAPDAVAEVAAELRGLLWLAHHEFNAIRARSGAPLDQYGMTTVSEIWWDQLTRAIADAVGPAAKKPWPSDEATVVTAKITAKGHQP